MALNGIKEFTVCEGKREVVGIKHTGLITKEEVISVY